MLVLKVSVYCLDISSIVREAVETSCLSTLVCKVRSLWLQSYRLLREVEALRDQYVINSCAVSQLYFGICYIHVLSK